MQQSTCSSCLIALLLGSTNYVRPPQPTPRGGGGGVASSTYARGGGGPNAPKVYKGDLQGVRCNGNVCFGVKLAGTINNF